MNKCKDCNYSYQPECLPDKGCVLKDVQPCSWPDVCELDEKMMVRAKMCAKQTSCETCPFYCGEKCGMRICHDEV